MRSLAPDVDAALEAVVLKSIAKDPSQRYPNAAAMLAALIPHGARAPGPSDVIDSQEGPAFSTTALQPTTPVSSDLLGDLIRDVDRTSPLERPGASADRASPERRSPHDRPAAAERPAHERPATPDRAASPERPALAGSATPRGGDKGEDVRTSSAHRSPPQARPSIDRAIRHGAPATRPAAAPAPPSVAGGGARYFFAASDDWDEARARAATDARTTPSFRDPASGPRDVLPREDASGAREPVSPHAREHDGRSSLQRDGAPGDRSGTRALTPEADAPSTAGREPTGPFSTFGSGDRTIRAPGAEPEVKGSLVIAALDHLETTHGAAVVEAIRRGVDRDALARLGSVILPMAWLPLALYDQLLRSAERVLGGSGEGTASAAIGRATADRDLPTTHRLFMQTASPSAAAERIPQMFKLYNARGEARVSATPGAGVRVEIDAGAPESLSFAWAMAGFWQRMLELTGAREVRAAVVSCRGRGDPQTAITLRWR